MGTLLYLKRVTSEVLCIAQGLCSMNCSSLDGRGLWGRMDTCVCVVESLSCLPEMVTTLLVGSLWLRWQSVCLVPCGSDGKASACNEGDPGSIPGWGRSPGEGNGKPLQYSCLEKPMDLVGNSPWSRKESDTTERLHFIVVVESLSHV